MDNVYVETVDMESVVNIPIYDVNVSFNKEVVLKENAFESNLGEPEIHTDNNKDFVLRFDTSDITKGVYHIILKEDTVE